MGVKFLLEIDLGKGMPAADVAEALRQVARQVQYGGAGILDQPLRGDVRVADGTSLGRLAGWYAVSEEGIRG